MSLNLLKEIIIVSEKAANIARICRKDDHLLKLLTQEKSEIEKNQRFVQDFKTLADVLIQEIIKYHLTTKFPVLTNSIYGEESNVFTNTNGDTITIAVTDDTEHTKADLIQILNGDSTAAESLCETIYAEPEIPSDYDLLPNVPVTEQYGIWIDPIDATSEYIGGNLTFALVLIGVYNKADGSPVLGVINQPFNEEIKGDETDITWKSKIYWGVCLDDLRQHSELPVQDSKREALKIALSSSESSQIKNCLLENGYAIAPLPGAGFKCLSVILNDCDLYLNAKGSTYVWDTLACHAILKSLGTDNFINLETGVGIGNIIECNTLTQELIYNRNDINTANSNGLIVYRDKKSAEEVLEKIKHLLKQ